MACGCFMSCDQKHVKWTGFLASKLSCAYDWNDSHASKCLENCSDMVYNPEKSVLCLFWFCWHKELFLNFLGNFMDTYNQKVHLLSNISTVQSWMPRLSLVNVVMDMWVGVADTVRWDIFTVRCESDSRYSILESIAQISSKPLYLQRDRAATRDC